MRDAGRGRDGDDASRRDKARAAATTTTTTTRETDVERRSGAVKGERTDAGLGRERARATSQGAAGQDGVFNVDALRAAVDRHHRHFSSEVERAWRESNFSFGFGRGSAGGEFARESGDEGDDARAHRAGRKKTLSISAFREMARRASQDSLAKLDDAKFMERFEKLRRPRRSAGGDGRRTSESKRDERKSRPTSTQDLQALIAKNIPKAPAIPKWGEEWDVFKAIGTNFNQDDGALAKTPQRPNRTLNRRRAQSETVVDRSPGTSPRKSPKEAPETARSPREMSRSSSTDALTAMGDGDADHGARALSETSSPREGGANVLESLKKEITKKKDELASRLPRPPSLPKLTTDLQNAVRRFAGQPEEIVVKSPYDASLSSPGVVLKRAESKELAAELEASEA
ncbi:predicted protein, partial [Ostreococcus lucimarinus CCE9901]